MRFKAILAFFYQYYERIIAVFVMLLLVVFSGWLFTRANSLQSEIGHESEVEKGKRVALGDLKKMVEALERLSQPVEWTTNSTHRLFIAPYMISSNGVLVVRDPGQVTQEPTAEGLPKEWLKRYRLSIARPVADTDPDDDGFTIREEWQAKMDPTDPKDHPDYALKLRIYGSLTQDLFPFIFNGVSEQGGNFIFSVIRRDRKAEYSVKLNGTIPDKEYRGYKIINYQEKVEKREDRTFKLENGKFGMKEVDVSELTIQKEGMPAVVLVKRQQAKTPGYFANLVFLIDQNVFRVTESDIFELQNGRYQVLSVKKLDDGSAKVVIQKVDSEGNALEGKQFDLLPWTREDSKRTKSLTPAQPGFMGQPPMPSEANPQGFPPPPFAPPK